MSDLTDLIEGKHTFSQIAAKYAAMASTLISHDPLLQNAASAILTDVKQAASNAVTLADTYIGAAILPAAKGVEIALDASLATLTKGVSIPFNGFVNDGIDQMAAAIKAEADSWSLRAKAALITQSTK